MHLLYLCQIFLNIIIIIIIIILFVHMLGLGGLITEAN